MIKTVRDACEVDSVVFNYKEAGGIETLVQTINAPDGGVGFFDRTYMTDGLKKLLREGLMRLSGQSDQALFELTQAMGGGKSHLMSALGILAKNPGLRSIYLNKEDADLIGKEPFKVVTFDGRNSPDHFLWGDIADQIGPNAASVMKRFHKDGPRAPGKDDWMNVIGDQPILFLFDELPDYFLTMSAIPAGAGTAADVLTSCLSHLFAAVLELPRCCIVLSNLKSSYKKESSKLEKLVDTANKEARRQARKIIPVDMRGEEIYSILRKRLFQKLPGDKEISAVADEYVAAIKKAENAGFFVSTSESIEAIRDQIKHSYPFHYSFKHVVAMFKDNPDFKETRGLLQFTAALLKSVWEREENDVYLIGTQHLNLRSQAVFPILQEINSTLNSAISRDISDRGGSHAEKIDMELKSPVATETASLVLSASLSQAVDRHRGLKESEVLEYVMSPTRPVKSVRDALERLRERCWYLHKEDGKVFFKNTENLVKRIESQAENLPQAKVNQALQVMLKEALHPKSKEAYQEILVMPDMNDIKIGANRTLLVVSPDHSVPPESVNLFFSSVDEKNQILVLTGTDEQALKNTLDATLRRHVAISYELNRMSGDDPLREEAEAEERKVRSRLYQALSQTFDRLYFPSQNVNTGSYELTAATIDGGLHFSPEGARRAEEQIEELLRSDRCYHKLAKKDADGDEWLRQYIAKAEDFLWPHNIREAPWSDILRASRRNPEWTWLPGSSGMENLKVKAVSEGKWRINDKGYVEKGPFPKNKTSLTIRESLGSNDQDTVVLELTPRDAGSSPVIYYAETPDVSEASAQVQRLDHFETGAISLYFLAVDPTGEHEAGEPVLWRRKIDVKYAVDFDSMQERTVRLSSVPSGIDMYYTLDGTNPKDGHLYEYPIEIGDDAVTLLVYAKRGEVEVDKEIKIPANRLDEQGRPEIDDSMRVKLKKTIAPISLDTTEKVFKALEELRGTTASMSGVMIDFGEGDTAFRLSGQSNSIGVDQLEKQIREIRKILNKNNENVSVTVRDYIDFESGRDLKNFAEVADILITHDNIEQ